MWIDIIIAVLVIFCIVQGYRYGFAKTVIDTLGWFISVAAAYYFSTPAVDYIKANTDLYEKSYAALQAKMTEKGVETLQSLIDAMPQVIKEHFYSGIDSLTSNLAGSLTDLFFKIAAFVGIVLVLKFIFWAILVLISKKHHKGIIGALDGITGSLTGLVKAVVIAYVFLALLVPLSGILDSTFITDALSSSFAAKYLYDYNLLLMVIDKFTG